MAGSDHQNNDINIINISTTTNTTDTKRHDGFKDKCIIISSRIMGPTELNYRQHCNTFVNKTITYLRIKGYLITRMTTDRRWSCKGGYIAGFIWMGAFNAKAQCHDDGGSGGGSNVGTFASSMRSGKAFHNEKLILPPDSV